MSSSPVRVPPSLKGSIQDHRVERDESGFTTKLESSAYDNSATGETLNLAGWNFRDIGRGQNVDRVLDN